jgi:hypothetical protein
MINDAIIQNTAGYSTGYPAGVPKLYAWYRGATKQRAGGPPSHFTAVTGWGSIYRESRSAEASEADQSIDLANGKTYVHIKDTKQWRLVQDQASNQMAGAHFVPNFSSNDALPMKIEERGGGAITLSSPPAGYNNHFWPAMRGTFDAGTVDAVYFQIDIKVSHPEPTLIAHVGVDWWLDDQAEFVTGFHNNPTAGASNWVTLTDKWSTLRFYSGAPDQLRSNPPPPLAPDETATISNCDPLPAGKG